jgi:hypothetical protein
MIISAAEMRMAGEVAVAKPLMETETSVIEAHVIKLNPEENIGSVRAHLVVTVSVLEIDSARAIISHQH